MSKAHCTNCSYYDGAEVKRELKKQGMTQSISCLRP